MAEVVGKTQLGCRLPRRGEISHWPGLSTPRGHGRYPHRESWWISLFQSMSIICLLPQSCMTCWLVDFSWHSSNLEGHLGETCRFSKECTGLKLQIFKFLLYYFLNCLGNHPSPILSNKRIKGTRQCQDSVYGALLYSLQKSPKC